MYTNLRHFSYRRNPNKLCSPQVHRLVVVDEQEVVMGIVSLSDILQALVLTNGDEGENTALPINPAMIIDMIDT